MQRIKKGDEVVVLAGRDKGKRGTVMRRIDADHLVVEGVNRVKKHQRPNPMKGITGGIVDKDLPIHISNVALFNPATKKADRAGVKTLLDGRKGARVQGQRRAGGRVNGQGRKVEARQAGEEAGPRSISSRAKPKKEAAPKKEVAPQEEPRPAAAGSAGAPRLRSTRTRWCPTDAEVRLQDRDAGAAPAQDHHQHGRRRDRHRTRRSSTTRSPT
jgi:large subunit ribosomal protein L24